MSYTYEGREIYARSPLEFVACEIRYPYAPALTRDTAADELVEAFVDELPIFRKDSIQSLKVGAGKPETDSETRFRFMNASRTASVVVGRSALVIETTHYEEYSEFRDVVERAVQTVDSVSRIAGVDRVGLRYINEVRVPGPIGSVLDWKEWIAAEVVAPTVVVDDLAIGTMETVLRAETSSGMLTIRMAALDGNGVIGNNPLRRRSPAADGPFFVIDIDSYAEVQDGLIEFDAHSLGRLLDDLHSPVGQVFQSVVTPQLRDVIRGEDE